jgi:hypothetical protein
VDEKSRIQINVIDWGKGNRNVAVYFVDLNQMVTMEAESARTFAFALMECADYLEPPFAEPGGVIDPNDNSESELFFGPDGFLDTMDDDETDES